MNFIESVTFDNTASFRHAFRQASPTEVFVAFQRGYLVLRSKEELIACNFQYAPRSGRIIAKGDAYGGRTYSLSNFVA